MSRRYTILLFTLCLSLWGSICPVFAQKDTTSMNQQVEVVKAYRPSVSNAEKINLLPEIIDTTRFRPDLHYNISSHPITSGFQSSSLKASNLVRHEISNPGIGEISGGFGTYMTPFAEVSLNNPASQNGTLGLVLNHLSSRGSLELKGGSRTDAPFSCTKGAVFGSYVFEGITITSRLSYQRDMNRFYGYPVEIPSDILTNNFTSYFNTDQLNQLGSFDLIVKSNATSVDRLKFDTGINLGYFNTSTSQLEKSVKVKGDFIYDFGTFSGKLSSGFDHFNTGNVTPIPGDIPLSSPQSSWLRLSPSVRYQTEGLILEGGLNLFSVFDGLNGNTFKPYPDLQVSYRTAENNFTFYAGMKGYLQNNNLSTITAENRWIIPALAVRPSDHFANYSAGIKGKISTSFAFDLGVKYSMTDDQYFYVTRIENKSAAGSATLKDLTYDNAFDVVYDNLSTLDFSGNISYTSPGMFLFISGHFYNYQTKTLLQAPYMPDFTIEATSDFKLTGSLKAMAEFYLTGPRNVMFKYFLPSTSNAIALPPVYLSTTSVIDVNLGLKYDLTPQFNLFGKVENLLNRKDEIWVGYTVQGLRLKLGVSFSF